VKAAALARAGVALGVMVVYLEAKDFEGWVLATREGLPHCRESGVAADHFKGMPGGRHKAE
jgi:hypothetical protein